MAALGAAAPADGVTDADYAAKPFDCVYAPQVETDSTSADGETLCGSCSQPPPPPPTDTHTYTHGLET